METMFKIIGSKRIENTYNKDRTELLNGMVCSEIHFKCLDDCQISVNNSKPIFLQSNECFDLSGYGVIVIFEILTKNVNYKWWAIEN